METYIRLIAVLIVGCRGVNVLLRAKAIRFDSQSCTFFLKKSILIIREGLGRLKKHSFLRDLNQYPSFFFFGIACHASVNITISREVLQNDRFRGDGCLVFLSYFFMWR